MSGAALLLAFCSLVAPPLASAHAHNDYHHPRPLLDALDQGFCSVEADVFLVDGKLLVGHERRELKPERTLEALYLDPLRERTKANGGRVQPGAERFWLLIDFKTSGVRTYDVLRGVLAKYADILSSVNEGRIVPGAVTIVISGDRPIAKIKDDKTRRCGVDGRLADLKSNPPADLVPWISDNWHIHFRWRGRGEIDAAEMKKLKEIVAQAHQQGRRIRFWANPDTPAGWAVLADAGVDFINTDNLAGLAGFLRER